MEIKILGTGCSGCRALYEATVQAVAEAAIDATVLKEEDMAAIMAYDVMRLPALVVDGKVISAGKKLSVTEIKELLIQ